MVETCNYTSIQHNEIAVFMVNANYFVYRYLPMNVIVKGHAAITCKILNPLLTAYGKLKRITDKFLQQPYTNSALPGYYSGCGPYICCKWEAHKSCSCMTQQTVKTATLPCSCNPLSALEVSQDTSWFYLLALITGVFTIFLALLPWTHMSPFS